MKKKIIQLFVWSWIISLPLALIGGYWLYNTMDRFNEYSVRYYNGKMSLYLVVPALLVVVEMVSYVVVGL